MNILKFLVIGIVVLSFLSLIGLGPWHAFQMTMDDQGNMQNCIFDVGEQSICAMDVFEHLSLWQRLLVAVPMLLVALTVGFWYRRQSLIADTQGISEQLYSHQDFRLKLFDYLRRVFSQGILHPKIY